MSTQARDLADSCLEHKTVIMDPVSPVERLGIYLYRFNPGDYYLKFVEMTGHGSTAVRNKTWDVLVH